MRQRQNEKIALTKNVAIAVAAVDNALHYGAVAKQCALAFA